jgi:hypothetical protein
MKPAFLALVLTLGSGFCLTGIAHAQPSDPQDEHAKLLTGKKRSLIAYAGNGHSFTLEIGAHTAKPSDIPGFITIDKQIVQSTLVPVAKSENLNLHALTTEKEKAILLDYMNYELKYYRKKAQSTLFQSADRVDRAQPSPLPDMVFRSAGEL